MELVHNTTTPDIETSSEGYRSRFAGPIGAYFLEVQEHCIAECLRGFGAQQLRILELGGGHGQITEFLLKAGHEVWVHGSDASCFDRLQTLKTAYGDRLHFVVSSLWAVPLPDRNFDVVIALRLMAHVETWRELLSELSRLAKSAVLIDFPAQSALNALTPLLFRFKRRIEGNTRPYFSYHLSALSDEFQALGLKRQLVKKEFALPMGVHRGLGRVGLSRFLEKVAQITGITRLIGSPVILAGFRE